MSAPAAGWRRLASVKDLGAAKNLEVSLLVLLVSIVYWFVSHTYEGVYHDAIVYALLVAGQLDPSAFKNDLFFLFGSQDKFTLFSPLYGLLISWVGFDAAAQAIVLCGGLLWVSAIFVLARVALPSVHPAHFIVLFLAAVTYSYSPNGSTFELNENFATSRVIASPLVLFALASWYSNWAFSRSVGLLLALLATALHPLLGVWAFVLFVLGSVSDRIVIAATILGVAALFGLSMAQLPLFRPMDQEWAELVMWSSRDVFVGPWDVANVNRVLAVIALLWLGGRFGNVLMRRAYLLMAMLVGWGYLVSQVCSYWRPIEIVMQSQPWRATWLGIVLAALATVDLGWAALRRGRGTGALAVFGAILLSVQWSVSSALLLVAVCISMSGRVRHLWDGLGDETTPFGRTGSKLLPIVVSVAALALLPGYWLDLEVLGASLSTPWWSGSDVLRGLLLGGGGGLGIVFLLWLAERHWPRRLLLILLLPILVLAVTSWDTRLPIARDFEKASFASSPLREQWSSLIPSGDVVAWPGRQESVWFELGRANYMTNIQAIGVVFSREKSMESKRRAERLAASTMLGIAPGLDDPDAALAAYGRFIERSGSEPRNISSYLRGQPSRRGVLFLCQDPALDWIVSPHADLSAGRGAVAAFGSGPYSRHFLHSCRDLRKPASR